MAERRAGGHIDRGDGKGWVIDDSPVPAAPEPQPHKPLQPTVQAAGGWRLSPEPPPAEPPTQVHVDLPYHPGAGEGEGPGMPEPERPTSAEVRAWAKQADIDVPARGRLPDDIIDQYLNRET